MSRPATETATTPRQIEIFAAGTHTAANGETRAWSVDDLGAIAAAYDPATFMAPIVVGHPKMNAPAYGWITGLKVEGRKLVGTVEQVNPEFAAAVKAGAYKKVSASFWPPEAKANPRPGTFQLRHVGFLGGHAPAVHGLKPAEFAEPETDVISFAELPLTASTINFGAIEAWSLAAAFDAVRRLFLNRRESVIAKEGVEAADKEVSNWDLESLANAAAKLREADAPAAAPAFAAPTERPTPEEPTDHGDADVNEKDKAALETEQAKLKAEREKLDRERVEFAAAKAGQEKTADETFVAGLVREGKVLPAETADIALAFAGFGGGTYDFAADSPEAKGKAALKKVLSGLGPRVPLKEAGAPGAHDALDHAGAGDDVARALARIRTDAKAAGEGDIDSAEAARRYRRARA